MSAPVLYVLGAGVIGPGLGGWKSSRPFLAGEHAWTSAPAAVPVPARLPPAERRRAGLAVRLAISVADDACTMAAVDPSALATVFTTSNADGANCHALCESLAQPDPVVSPTRFTHSVHNAPAGYWHIAVGSQEASTSLCLLDASFAAGLIEAAMQVQANRRPLLLVASDAPYADPLARVRPTSDSFGAAFVLGPEPAAGSLARLSIALLEAEGPESACDDAALDALRRGVPAARALPLLQALAAGRSGTLRFDHPGALQLQVRLDPR
jgi:hypothetical protein